MSSTTTPTTFVDLYTDLLNRTRANASGTTEIVYAKRYINQALHDIHIQQNWPWAERRATLLTHAPYTTGTVSIALATRTTVAGVSTLWNTAVTGMGFNNARAGGKLTFSGGTDVYEVSSVGSDTAITLTDRFIGDTALSAATYTYYEDEYALASDFFRLVDSRELQGDVVLEVLSRQEFYRRDPRNSTTDQPVRCTIIDLAPSGGTSTNPRMLLHPPPNAVYRIPYRYITSSLATSSAGAALTQLSADTDEPIIPLRYRHVLVFYAQVLWYTDYKDDPQRAQVAGGQYADLVKRMANDTVPERDRPRFDTMRRRYVSRVAGPRLPRSRVFQTGSEFDDMRV